MQHWHQWINENKQIKKHLHRRLFILDSPTRIWIVKINFILFLQWHYLYYIIIDISARSFEFSNKYILMREKTLTSFRFHIITTLLRRLFTTCAYTLHRRCVYEFKFHNIQVWTFRATFAFNFENSCAKNRKMSCKTSARSSWVNVPAKVV